MTNENEIHGVGGSFLLALLILLTLGVISLAFIQHSLYELTDFLLELNIELLTE